MVHKKMFYGCLELQVCMHEYYRHEFKLHSMLYRSLEDKVREYEIFDLRDFYMSTHFSKAEFQLDPGAGLITRHRSR